MSVVSLLTRAIRTQPVTVDSLARELGLTSPDDFDLLQEYLDDALGVCEDYLGYPMARQAYTELLPGTDTFDLVLSRTPLVSVQQVLSAGSALASTEYRRIDPPESGILHRETQRWESAQVLYGWLTFSPSRDEAMLNYQVDYWAGWLLPTDNMVRQTTITVTASTQTYADSAGGFPLLVAGDVVRFSGFTNQANNGAHVVVSRTASAVVVAETLVNESPASTTPITCTVQTLPRTLARAVREQARAWYYARRLDIVGPAIVQRDDGTQVQYARSGAGMNKLTSMLLDPYVQVRAA